MREQTPTRSDYRWFIPVGTRWIDNDVYGHVNNAVYYTYFDTIANSYLIERGGLCIQESDTVGYVVHSQCHYVAPVVFPDALEGALRVNRLGSSSVEYGLAIFRSGDENACAFGTFTHVFVDRNSKRPTAIDGALRSALQSLLVES